MNILPDGLSGSVALVIQTDLPLTWHCVDNLCSFCIGCPCPETTSIWLGRFFKDMGIDPKAKPQYDQKWHYPNPFRRYTTLALTDEHKEVYCAPWPNDKSVCFFFKKKLNQLLFDILDVRARDFCKSYPLQGCYPQVQEVYYIDLGQRFQSSLSAISC